MDAEAAGEPQLPFIFMIPTDPCLSKALGMAIASALQLWRRFHRKSSSRSALFCFNWFIVHCVGALSGRRAQEAGAVPKTILRGVIVTNLHDELRLNGLPFARFSWLQRLGPPERGL